MLRIILPCLALLAACGPSLPDLDARLSPDARAAEFPQLQPLPPASRDSGRLYPAGGTAQAGVTLEARAADLRRRAAALRAMPL